MPYFKVELTWHDHYEKRDRRFRSVVEADNVDIAFATVKIEVATRGLVDFATTVVCSQGEAFKPNECANDIAVIATKRYFQWKGFEA